MNKDFSCETSKLAWELFKHTGQVNYYCLYANIENPPELVSEDYSSRDDGLER